MCTVVTPPCATALWVVVLRAVGPRAGLGNRIEARGTQRSTTHEASKGQPGTTDRTVHFVCLMGVRRTRGVETTRRRPSGEGPLISLDQPERTPLHPCHVGGTDRSAVVRIRSFRQRSSSANVRSFARALAPMSSEPRWHVAVAKYCSKPSTQQVALDGRPGGATDGEGHLRWNHLGIGNERAPERIDPHTDAVSPEADECVAFADPVDQADRRARPLARRDFSTARPARVLMRARKPCLRARRRLLG